MEPDRIARKGVIAAVLAGLALVYVFQRFDYFGLMTGWVGQTPSSSLSFAVNRTVRLVLNDVLCLILVKTLFNDARYTRLAVWIFIAELFVLLPFYLVVKLSLEGPTELSSPMLQPLHRIIVNPLLMVILIAGCYFQSWKEHRSA